MCFGDCTKEPTFSSHQDEGYAGVSHFKRSSFGERLVAPRKAAPFESTYMLQTQNENYTSLESPAKPKPTKKKDKDAYATHNPGNPINQSNQVNSTIYAYATSPGPNIYPPPATYYYNGGSRNGIASDGRGGPVAEDRRPSRRSQESDMSERSTKSWTGAAGYGVKDFKMDKAWMSYKRRVQHDIDYMDDGEDNV